MDKERKVYTVATAHLDTVWNWDFEHTVDVCLKNTLEKNFKLFEKYPDYVFNFEGAYRYELMEEYYPEEFKRLKAYVRENRWFVSGSSYENGDVNIPSPEALFRNILYGNGYFEETFGKKSADIFLPDCFGFGFALPSIAEHSGLKGFSTQKLTWGSAFGTPFDLGKWYGVNGKWIYANLNPHAYDYTFKKIRSWDFLKNKLRDNEKYGLDMTALYHGVGDQGGAPKEKSVKVLTSEMAKNAENDVKVYSVSSDRVFYELEKGNYNKLPEWHNELVMQNHAVGGYTSRAVGKRWNRKCEELADMAERASAAAHITGLSEYPKEALKRAWKRTITHQFHDDMPGTSVQRAYIRSWNDYSVSLNEFEREYENAALAIADGLDTSGVKGLAVVVNNSREFARKGVVTAFVNGLNADKKLFASDGKNTYPAQLNDNGELCFAAEMPAVGFKVFDVYAEGGDASVSALKITKNTLENHRYAVKLDKNGDVTSIFDKKLNKELLQKPITMDLFAYDGSKDWPAWELKYSELNKVSELHPKFRSAKIIDNGAARVSLEIEQAYNNSIFKTKIYLDNNVDAVMFDVEIIWNELRTLLKHNFALNAFSKEASYDLGLGVIRRGNSTEKLYEVPAQKWADITDKSGDFGISIISECKYGWDKPADNILRLTAIHTPKADYRKDSKQSLMDLGLNKYSFAVTSHKGADLKETQKLAAEFLQPMTAFTTDKHKGGLGNEFSLCGLSSDGVILRALKLSEKGNKLIVRFNEAEGKTQKDVKFNVFGGVLSAKEIYADEQFKDSASVKDGKLIFDISPYDVKSFELEINIPECAPKQKQLDLPYDAQVTTRNGENGTRLGRKPFSVPAELLPEKLYIGGIEYRLGGKTLKNVMFGKGQTLKAEGYGKINMLCASLDGSRDFEFKSGGKAQKIFVREADERFAGWDLYGLNEKAFYNGGDIAYEITHTHTDGKNDTAHQIYLYRVSANLDKNGEIILPYDDSFVLFAATASNGKNGKLVTLTHDVPPTTRQFLPPEKKPFLKKLFR